MMIHSAGSSRHFAQHPTAHNIKDDGSVTLRNGKSSKRGTTSSGAHEVRKFCAESAVIVAIYCSSLIVVFLSSRNKFGFRSHLQCLRKSN
ncbi:hypothetical protein V6N12_029753 [Hibiscus sabdariffa]|uniref:Uncharacterized protein n=1 Tax=Hibiscus sabdariffa TaxID=183260 RepID=A0ABR2CX20_9ROSI